MPKPTAAQLAILKALRAHGSLVSHLDSCRLNDTTVSRATVGALLTAGLIRGRRNWPTTTYTLTRAGLAALRVEP